MAGAYHPFEPRAGFSPPPASARVLGGLVPPEGPMGVAHLSARSFLTGEGVARPLRQFLVSKALHGLRDPSFFNLQTNPSHQFAKRRCSGRHHSSPVVTPSVGKAQ